MQASSLALAAKQGDDWLDHLPPFTDGRFKSETKPVTFDQAVKSFVHRYPLRFDDPKYLENERNYKWEAHTYLATELAPWISGAASVTSGVARLIDIGISGAAVKVNLKPEVTKKAADRLLFDLLYSSKLSWTTYSRLLKMSQLLLDRLRPLGARDYIDVQSFIFLTGE
jgi:hypothetical protein